MQRSMETYQCPFVGKIIAEIQNMENGSSQEDISITFISLLILQTKIDKLDTLAPRQISS